MTFQMKYTHAAIEYGRSAGPVNCHPAPAFKNGYVRGAFDVLELAKSYEQACSQLARPHVRNLIDYLEKEMRK